MSIDARSGLRANYSFYTVDHTQLQTTHYIGICSGHLFRCHYTVYTVTTFTHAPRLNHTSNQLVPFANLPPVIKALGHF